MILTVPSYYPQFRCIADRCRHSCCVGWDVVVDDESADNYRAVDGELGDRLRRSMITDEDGDTVFCMTKERRCPFLQKDGLCELIIHLGEQSLCQICRDHPRFRYCFGDREEMGLGLCCEEAARLVICYEPPVTFVETVTDEEAQELTENEKTILRRREDFLAVAQNRNRPIEEREAILLVEAGGLPITYSPQEYHAMLLPLERLDGEWDQTISPLSAMCGYPSCDVPDTAFEQLLVYFLYRHLPYALDDDRLEERVMFAVHSVRILRLLCAAHGGTVEALCEVARQYSAEIEYSDENVDRLLDCF